MKYSHSDKREQQGIAKFILILFTVYDAFILLLAMIQKWEGWVAFILAMNLALSWILHVGKYRDYRVRAIVNTFAMQITLLLYMTQIREMTAVMAIFVAFVILAGLYGILDVLYITWASSALIIFYYVFIVNDIRVVSLTDAVRMLLQIVNLFLVQYAIHVWTKKRELTNRAFLETIEVLQKAEQSKDDFLANVSHEIRTPINTICGMSEVILSETDPKKIGEDVRNIQSASRNLMSVVSDILDFSELQAGKVELEEEAYNITSTINDVINMALAKKNEKQIELIVNCDADIPCELYGDEKKIRRVIMNILDNAIKFTKEGCVSLSITSRRESYGINLAIIIKDTGIGMKEESIEKLFTSFNQVDTKRNREEGGIGLGLAISQALVQCMGGVITVKSKYEKGTVVKVVIPQQVLDERPIVSIRKKESLNVAVYIDMEQFRMTEIRDEYMENIRNIIEQLQTKCHVCRNFGELKRRHARERFTHIFISGEEYRADTAYFDELAEQVKIVIVIDPEEEKDINNPKILRIYKPFYILPIASLLNGEARNVITGEPSHSKMFVAPTARILAVDDNEMNLKVIEALLERYRIQVTKSMSGREALEKIESMSYDIVFMDHMMPEMDGVETLHRIRNKAVAYYHKVPIIALTANAIAGAREMFLAEGFTDFLEKPIEASVLARVLRRNLPQEKISLVSDSEGDTKTDSDSGERLLQKERLLDPQIGLLYCGGEAGYRKVLICHSQTGDENREKIEQLFAQEDWKNYTIAVHGIKSAMLSIGATHLSELAKELETAGKKNDISYIREHHAKMVEEYRCIIENLKESFPDSEEITPEKQEEQEKPANPESLPLLADNIFDQRIQELETAMYELDGAQMLKIITELENYQYSGVALREALSAVRRKVEMTDYMSAMDVLLKLRERLQNGARGGDGA